jgi:putative endonuclease
VLKSDPETWKDPRHREGERAERLAAEVMEADGYEILEQRFRVLRHDVDLVARKGNVVVFVEVKARRSDEFGTGLEAVGARKQRELVRVASAWLSRHGRPEDVARFDVVVVRGLKVDWMQNAFRPGWR